MRITLITLSIFLFMFGNVMISSADHQGPERVVDGEYTIVLSILPGNDKSLLLKFFFTDTHTGARVSDIMSNLSIRDKDGVVILNNEPMDIENGVANLIYTFPESGLFELLLEFKKVGEDEKIYRPERWSVWVPGEDGTDFGSSYPVGLSEISSIALAGVALILIIRSFIKNRKLR